MWVWVTECVCHSVSLSVCDSESDCDCEWLWVWGWLWEWLSLWPWLTLSECSVSLIFVLNKSWMRSRFLFKFLDWDSGQIRLRVRVTLPHTRIHSQGHLLLFLCQPWISQMQQFRMFPAPTIYTVTQERINMISYWLSLCDLHINQWVLSMTIRQSAENDFNIRKSTTLNTE